MPSFTIEAADLQNEGPVISGTFSLTQAQQVAFTAANTPVPAPIQASKILIDTGASHSMVAHGLLAPLGLHPVGGIAINTPTSHSVMCPAYAVRLTFPHGPWIDTSVIESPAGGIDTQGLAGLVGRDVLQYLILIYLGSRGQFTVSS